LYFGSEFGLSQCGGRVNLDSNLRKLILAVAMKNMRRKHSDAFKTEVVLEALKERKTLSELALEYQLSPAQISSWKSEFLSNASSAFSSKRKGSESKDDLTDALFNQIGRLKMENEWLKKKLK
jgi:transposase